jgi:hypothetical protein
MLIPAGVLLGLGIGLLLGYPGPGVLIGLGLGFIGSTLAKPAEIPAGSPESHTGCARPRGFLALMGVFLVIVGIGIVWAPENLWPYIVSAFLILAGAWFLYHGVRRRD